MIAQIIESVLASYPFIPVYCQFYNCSGYNSQENDYTYDEYHMLLFTKGFSVHSHSSRKYTTLVSLCASCACLYAFFAERNSQINQHQAAMKRKIAKQISVFM